jgi:hypothetical protein
MQTKAGGFTPPAFVMFVVRLLALCERKFFVYVSQLQIH